MSSKEQFSQLFPAFIMNKMNKQIEKFSIREWNPLPLSTGPVNTLIQYDQQITFGPVPNRRNM